MNPLYQTYLEHRYPEWPAVVSARDAIRQIRYLRVRAAKRRLFDLPEISTEPGVQEMKFMGATFRIKIDYDDHNSPFEPASAPTYTKEKWRDRNDKSSCLIEYDRETLKYTSDYSYEDRIENYWKQFGTVRADQLARYWLDEEFLRVENIFFGCIYSMQYTIYHGDELIDNCGGFDSDDEDYLRAEIEDNVLSYVRSMSEEAVS